MNFNFKLPYTFISLVFLKNGLSKRYHPLKIYLSFKIALSHIDWFKFYIHLRCLNVCHFGMIKDMGL
jgi:hypothetical protein